MLASEIANFLNVMIAKNGDVPVYLSDSMGLHWDITEVHFKTIPFSGAMMAVVRTGPTKKETT